MQSRRAGQLGIKWNKKTCRYLMCIGRPTFLTFFLMPFFHMCCAFISKKHLALLVAGCFFFLFAFICLSIPVVRIGLFSNESVVKNDSPVRVYCPLISGCSLTPSVKNMSAKNKSLLPSNIGLFSNPVSVSAHKQRAPGPFCGAKLFLSILPLFLPVVNLNEHPKKPLVISFRRKMRLFI